MHLKNLIIGGLTRDHTRTYSEDCGAKTKIKTQNPEAKDCRRCENESPNALLVRKQEDDKKEDRKTEGRQKTETRNRQKKERQRRRRGRRRGQRRGRGVKRGGRPPYRVRQRERERVMQEAAGAL